MIPVALLVVAKAPVAGLVKTRLTPPLSPRDAARVAAASLLDTLAAVAECPVERRVVALTGMLADGDRADEIATALTGFEVIDQRGPDFARRLVNAHLDCGALTGLPVLQIGMDTPQAGPVLLARCAETLLANGDAALGRAGDGGWWALGLDDPRDARVLAAVPMSTDRTGEATRQALEDAGVRVTELPSLDDVDDVADALSVSTHVDCGSNFRRIVAELHSDQLRG